MVGAGGFSLGSEHRRRRARHRRVMRLATAASRIARFLRDVGEPGFIALEGDDLVHDAELCLSIAIEFVGGDHEFEQSRLSAVRALSLQRGDLFPKARMFGRP